MAIIRSILDTDLYKFTMQKFVLDHYGDVEVEYIFINRDMNMKLTPFAFEKLQEEVNEMSKLRLQDNEYDWMKNTLYFVPVWYLQYLASYRFNPSQVLMRLDEDYNLEIRVKGKWRETILWEVPLLALVSEIYFKHVDTFWEDDFERQVEIANQKAKAFQDAGIRHTEFGTRRRRRFETQDLVVKIMKNYSTFNGTSNPYLAMKHGVKCNGTIAHEAIMGVSELESLNHANYYTMEKWQYSYQANLGIMLTDTYGAKGFLDDFKLKFAKVFDGVRHDSGCPFKWTDTYIEAYQKMGIDPKSKLLFYSDNLNTEKGIEIAKYNAGRTKIGFGIGTFYTNDYLNPDGTKSKPMNIVIKLCSVNGKPVCKLSDEPSKSTGDINAIKMAKYIYFEEKMF